MTGPTKRQLEVLRRIRGFIRCRGCSPSFTELRQLLGEASNNGVHQHIRLIRKKGYLRMEPFLSRTLRLTAMGHAVLDGVELLLRCECGVCRIGEGVCVGCHEYLRLTPEAVERGAA